MDALEYMKTHGEAHCDVVAQRAGTSLGYFKQIAYRHRRPGVDLAQRIERETHGAVTATELLFAELKRPIEQPPAEAA